MRGESFKFETKGFFLVGLVFLLLVLPMASAGVGLSWNKESALVKENTKTCLTYNVYNPFDKDTYAKIVLSKDMQDIMTSSSSEAKFIPSNTNSSNGIPITFCFKTPKVYPKDCLIGNTFLCKQTCNETMKTYSGEVQAQELSAAEVKAGGSGGSKTQMSVSAPIRIRVQCVPHGRDYSLVYGIVALIAAVLLLIRFRKKRKLKDGSMGVKKTSEKEDLEKKNKELEKKLKELEKEKSSNSKNKSKK